MNRDKYILYLDDTGNRKPGILDISSGVQSNSMDCFGLGGILIKEENIEELLQGHETFCSEWGIDYPLHSTKIRGNRGKFGWLGKQENKDAFLPALQNFLLSLPLVGIACIVDRPGYSYRYRDIYHNNLWPLPKTTFCILIERSAKFAEASNRNLEVCFEQAGKKEDRRIIQYLKDLKRDGNPFDEGASGGYKPLVAEDYRRIVLGEPHRMTKDAPQVQVADLILYPMARSGYDPDYYPYRKLKEAGKLIGCLVPKDEVLVRGIKYSCFED